ncbi:unnamed protein product [Phaeothamnion confervicola]
MNTLRRARPFLVTMAPLCGLVVWNEYAKAQKRKPPPDVRFQVGSPDDLTADGLRSGDMLFFRRRLSSLQPLAVALTAATRQLTGARFDGVGVVITDRLGVPWILELTYGGLRYRRYDERVLWSKSREILLVRLAFECDEQHRRALERYATMSTGRYVKENVGNWTLGQMQVELQGLVKFVCCRKLGKDPDAFMEDAVFSPAANLALVCLDRLGALDVRAMRAAGVNPRHFTVTDLAEQRVPLREGVAYGTRYVVRDSD